MTTTEDTSPAGTPDDPAGDDSLGEVLETFMDRLEAVTSAKSGSRLYGLPTGFTELDSLTGGLEPGTLTVIASRPGMGRTTLLSDICRANAIKRSNATLVYTLEESARHFTQRIAAAESRVARHHMSMAAMAEDDWARLARRMPDISKAPLVIRAPARIDMTFLALQAAELAEAQDLKLIAVDGIQDIRPERRSDLREREVGDIVRDLKTLARELEVPVVATAHLNRGPESRFDKRPRLDDLRESGAITFAADTIVLLHRDDYYDPATPRAGEADLIVAKNRLGPLATSVVVFQGHYGRFMNWVKD